MARKGGVVVRFIVCAAALALFVPSRPTAAQQFNESLFKAMKWRSIGPYRGGRALAVAGVPGDTSTYYFGAVAGGVWKTSDAGSTWQPLFDKESVSSIGSIAVAESDPNVIYAGTGEACIRGNISFGDGVYKSTDAGKSWKNVGLRDTRHIGRLIVHPRNPDIVLVAALGHAYGPNPERGIFRSTDGGKTWEKVLYQDEKTGGIDLVFDPTNPHILFAALWEAYRTPWSLTSGGPGSGLYKSTDGGTSWKRLEGNGLPKGILGRTGVAVSGADPSRVYALMEAEEGGLYRSDDGGEKWTRVNDDHRFTQRAWYFHHIFADPKNVDGVYVLNTGFYHSTDGGKTFKVLPAPHGDHHGLWIDPNNPQRVINSNDGGANVSIDAGKTWSRQDNQPTAQFYHVAADTRFPYYVYGAQQDNSTVAIATRSGHGAIDRSDWYPVGGGESGFVVPYPSDPNIVYAGSYEGLITRFDKRTGQAQDVTAWPENPMGSGAADLKHRFQWTAPIAVSPHDSNVLYHGAEVLFKTTNGGKSWTAISPDLTRNDKSKQQASGGPLTKDNTSVEYYDTIFAVAESPRQKDLIWVGTDDGLVHLTRDGGKSWTNVTPKELPGWSMVSLIEPSPHEAARAYLAIDRHKLDDYRPHVYKTADFGKTWTKITMGLPENSYVHAVREDPKRRGLLYAGTETGVFVSFNDGARWQSLRLNLPTTPIHDLVVKDADLVVATHGRSFWILDDVAPLRQFEEKSANADVYLYQPAPAYRFRGPTFVIPGSSLGAGVNPPAGANLDYFLKSVPKDEATLEIRNTHGELVRKFSSRKSETAEPPSEFPGLQGPSEQLPTEAALNRFVWDLRYAPPSKVTGAVYWGGRPMGPLVVPGTYQVLLSVAGKNYTAPLEVKADPRISATREDLEKQLELALKIRDRASEALDAVNQIRSVRSQLDGLGKRLGSSGQYKAILSGADEMNRKMTAVEDALIQAKSKSNEDPLNYPIRLSEKLMALHSTVESADAAPTQQSYEVFQSLSGQIEQQVAAWKDLTSKNLVALNEMMRKENVPLVWVAPPTLKVAAGSAP